MVDMTQSKNSNNITNLTIPEKKPKELKGYGLILRYLHWVQGLPRQLGTRYAFRGLTININANNITKNFINCPVIYGKKIKMILEK